ncbi:hypothetical protein TNIN_333411 [Trichonephila inaurata madagascariensis]|uniref:Uncharacterized protein n=1 Tax=Trichonephila inaurata madagascariensis TaxID=2747483 RepID=A0A8X6X068_9ARAC|nr:hypothetical protein TNIN_333411 [Trichonephila inaurata madagascariensis]
MENPLLGEIGRDTTLQNAQAQDGLLGAVTILFEDVMGVGNQNSDQSGTDARNRRNTRNQLDLRNFFLSKTCVEPYCVINRYETEPESRLIKRTINQSNATNGKNSKRSLIPTASYASLLARDLDSRKRVKNYIDSINEMGPESIKAEMIHEHAIVPTDSYHNLPNTLEELPSLKNKVNENIPNSEKRKQIEEKRFT